MAAPDTPTEFAFAFDPFMAALARPLGIKPSTTRVEIANGALRIRFGPWSLRTPLTNIACTQVTGPYALYKVAGPARLSFADRGVTFATNRDRGLCMEFDEPVPALLPGPLLRHPGATVTVADPDGLAVSIAALRGA